MRKHLTPTELRRVTAGLVQSWRDQAACKGRVHDAGAPNERLTRQAIRQARAICADCPVLTDCAWHRLQIAGYHARKARTP